MASVKTGTSLVVAPLIGDVVGSRSHPDRQALHRRLSAALALTSVTEHAVDAPALTVGDEFQGSYDTVGHAVDAALSIRLAVAPDIDIRFGVGWGEVARLDTDSGIQDGPGWWAAREAIEWIAAAQQQSGLAHVRTAYRLAPTVGPDPRAVNAALMCRDHLLGSLDQRSLRILTGLRQGRSKKELAVTEQISASAVSQRAGRDGLDLLLATAEELRGVR